MNHCSVPHADTWTQEHMHLCLARDIVWKRCYGDTKVIADYLTYIEVKNKPIASISNLRQLCRDAYRQGLAK